MHVRGERSTALLPVVVPDREDSGAADPEPAEAGTAQAPAASGGMIHIEFPGSALGSIERGVRPAVVRAIVESLRR